MQALSGEIPRALPELVRCLAEARNTGGDEDLFHALHSLGYVLTLAGRAREGEPLLREALRTGAKFLADTGPSIGMCSLELGECLERQGRLTEARAFYQVARDNFRNHYGPVYITRRADAQLASVTARISSGSGVR
jgi:tetratricopeptide (TPR) repeat protein